MNRIMKKSLFFVILPVTTVLLSGCSSIRTPEPVPAPAAAATEAAVPVQAPAVQSPLIQEMQKLSAEIVAAGGLAVVGTDNSKSIDLALNMAKRNGRIELSRMLNLRIETLAKAFSEETGIPYESLLLSGFSSTEKVLAGQIAGSVAQTLKYETSGDTFTAYALMVLDPKIIADQLAQQKDLFARLQPTKAFGTLTQEIKTYEAFKAAQK